MAIPGWLVLDTLDSEPVALQTVALLRGESEWDVVVPSGALEVEGESFLVHAWGATEEAPQQVRWCHRDPTRGGCARTTASKRRSRSGAAIVIPRAGAAPAQLLASPLNMLQLL